ncbi:winged helix-turn-helix transcriptional regulator [Streptoalloteichus hindustanus]|uniref:Transcriptional regulator, HxlR family n=1 Tax=Streptoalloteichus hindustanus TaxID=2017 RepID=A0A1M5FBY5_STRHI|nr:helix-turn-helix domain-containing protein [Streptoalloteichus hindustanus]SHF89103.1 transcriptional regulator, HxlR family [Streptoalloteichus hindustanus]
MAPSTEPTASAEEACPITPVVDLVFSRWTTSILWVLSRHGRLRFTELAGLVGSITPKVLTQRLRQLERDGLVRRTAHAEVPPRVEYEVTELGHSLSPVFDTLTRWADQHLARVRDARHDYDTAGRPRPA